MTVKFLDPYKDDPYAKLRGEKNFTYFKVAFDEAKVYPIENGYYLAAYCTAYTGVVRNFNAQQALEPGLCAIPLYNSEYEIRSKVNGEYVTTKYQPSILEKALCDLIQRNESVWVGDDIAISGEITFLPDDMLLGQSDEFVQTMVQQNAKVSIVTPTGKLKPYTPPSGNSQRKGGNWSKGVSLEDKENWVKKQLAEGIKKQGYNAEMSLADLTDQIHREHEEDEAFLTLFFDMLMAVVRG